METERLTKLEYITPLNERDIYLLLLLQRVKGCGVYSEEELTQALKLKDLGYLSILTSNREGMHGFLELTPYGHNFSKDVVLFAFDLHVKNAMERSGIEN